MELIFKSALHVCADIVIYYLYRILYFYFIIFIQLKYLHTCQPRNMEGDLGILWPQCEIHPFSLLISPDTGIVFWCPFLFLLSQFLTSSLGCKSRDVETVQINRSDHETRHLNTSWFKITGGIKLSVSASFVCIFCCVDVGFNRCWTADTAHYGIALWFNSTLTK